MHVVLANRLLDRPGGEQKQLLKLAQLLVNRGHRVSVVTVHSAPDACYPASHAGLTVRSVYADARRDGPPPRTLAQRAAARVAAERQQWHDAVRWAQLVPPDADLINWHGGNPQVAWLALRDRPAGRRWAWMCNDLPAPIYGIAARSRVSGAPKDPRFYASVVADAPRALEAFARARVPPGPITVLDETNRFWWKTALRRDAIVVPWGLDYERLYRPVQRRAVGEPLWVLAAGICNRFRRFEDTIRAVAIARRSGADVRLRVVGEPADTNYVAELQALVEELRLEGVVEITGYLANDAYERVRAGTHVLVLTTMGQTWGQVTTESAAAGIPSIINETATTLEFFRDDVSTLVARYADPESVARSLVRLATDEDTRIRIATAAQHLVGMLSWERYARAMEEVFVRTLAGVYD